MAEQFKKTQVHIRYKTEDGTLVPGVTTVLGVLDKGRGLLIWANKCGLAGQDINKVTDASAAAGTLAHEMIAHRWGAEEPDYDAYSKELLTKAQNAVRSYEAWEQHHTLEPQLVEEPMVSEQFKFGGTLDCYGLIDGKPGIVDLKTSKAIYDSYFYQLAAYCQLLEERGYPVETVRILRIGRDESEGFEERFVNRDSLSPYFSIFRHCLAIYNLRKKIGG
jgi:hypothetical protein